MKIYVPTAKRFRDSGIIYIKNVNTKTVQDILVKLRNANLRYVIRDISLISKTVSSVSNGASVTVQEVDESVFTAATLSTSMTGANNDVTITAQTAGADGNDITIALIDPSGNDQALSVAVTGTDIVVSLATDSGGTITTTAAQLITAIEADPDADALIAIANKGADTGTGVVTALSETPLAGGLDWTVKDTLVNSTDLADSDKTGLIQGLTLVSDREVIEGGNSFLVSVTNGSTATTDVKDILAHYTIV